MPTENGYCVPPSVTATRTDGTTYTYRPDPLGDPNIYYVEAGNISTGVIVYNPAAKMYMHSYGGKKYNYNSAGVIQSVVGPSGVTLLKYTYNGSTITIQNAAGRTLALTWGAHGVTKIVDPAGNPWTYAYDANGMLKTVTSPGTSPDVRTYYYDDPNDKSLLTGIAVNGVRYSTYAYNSNRQVTKSALANGDADTFAYSSGQTTVKSAGGRSVVYKYASVNGTMKIKSQTGAATSSCASWAASTEYDGNGFVDYTIDQNGNKTDYDYDSKGRLLQIKYATGASVTNAWSDDLLMSTTSYSTSGVAFAKVAYTYSGSKVASVTQTDLTSAKWFDRSPSATATTRTALCPNRRSPEPSPAARPRPSPLTMPTATSPLRQTTSATSQLSPTTRRPATPFA